MDKKEKFTAEIAKQLPVKGVYNDLLQPTLSTVGKSLQGATRVALAPITALVWGYDQISSYLDTAIPEYFEKRKIPKEKVISPDPAIAVPVIIVEKKSYYELSEFGKNFCKVCLM